MFAGSQQEGMEMDSKTWLQISAEGGSYDRWS